MIGSVKPRKRWPRSVRAKEIFGDGRYTVLTCAFQHPSAAQMTYSEVHLFETDQEAREFKATLDSRVPIFGVLCQRWDSTPASRLGF